MAIMEGPKVDAPGRPKRHGLAFTLATIVCGFGAGFVLPIVLFLVLVGVPVALGPGIGWMVNILGLPDPFGLIVWYIALGAIGGILPDTAKWAYGTGLFVFFGAPGATLIVWPWVVLGLVAWIVLDLLALLTDERSPDG